MLKREQLRKMSEEDFQDLVDDLNKRQEDFKRKLDAADSQKEYLLRDPKLNKSKIQKLIYDRERLVKDITDFQAEYQEAFDEYQHRNTKWTAFWESRRRGLNKKT